MRSHKKTVSALAGLTLTAALTLTGCVVHTHPRHPPQARAVVVARGHVHTDSCGHYRHRGRWYLIKGHVHRPGCGHVKVRGVWVLRG